MRFRIGCSLVAVLAAHGQDRGAIERWVVQRQPQIMAEFLDLLVIPNVATPRLGNLWSGIVTLAATLGM
jgi:hypothetical protein